MLGCEEEMEGSFCKKGGGERTGGKSLQFFRPPTVAGTGARRLHLMHQLIVCHQGLVPQQIRQIANSPAPGFSSAINLPSDLIKLK